MRLPSQWHKALAQSPEHRPCRLEQRKDVLHAGLRRDRALRVVVSGGVAIRLAHLDVLHDAILDDEHEALAPGVAQSVLGAGVVHAHADGLRELAPGVRQERDDRAIHSLVLRPRLHHGAVVHAVDQDLINALGLQVNLLAQIARDLHRGSAWREGTRQPQDDDCFALRALQHVDLPDWVEAMVDGDRRDRVPRRDHLGGHLRCKPLRGGHGRHTKTARAPTTKLKWSETT
mmetsp:Transcript_8491/g.30546  ORF Transcript_8491/g.30546 Transcript_8491/m.30546 type:complete len:231 (-) Transcript_8491:30-722(-)